MSDFVGSVEYWESTAPKNMSWLDNPERIFEPEIIHLHDIASLIKKNDTKTLDHLAEYPHWLYWILFLTNITHERYFCKCQNPDFANYIYHKIATTQFTYDEMRKRHKHMLKSVFFWRVPTCPIIEWKEYCLALLNRRIRCREATLTVIWSIEQIYGRDVGYLIGKSLWATRMKKVWEIVN